MTRIDLDHYQYVRVSGPDAIQFLQGQLSCNLDLLAADRSLRGALCNLKGRVIADLRILQQDQDCLLQTGAGLAEAIVQTLSKYAVFSKVELGVETPAQPAMGIIGSDAEEQLLTVFGSLPQQADQVVQTEAASLIRMPGIDDRYELWFQGGAVADPQKQSDLAEQLQAIAVAGLDHWEREEILAGVVHITPQMSEEHTPQLLNYDIAGIIDFNKGCYTGQEVVARMYYRGKPKKRLYLLSSEQEVSAASTVLQVGEEQGKSQEILAFSNAGSEGSVLLAILGTEAVADGAQFCLSDQPELALQVLPLPYLGSLPLDSSRTPA